MKIASIILRVVAVLAAAFCIYAWVDTKGLVSSAEKQMANIEGATLAQKAAEASRLAGEHKELTTKQVPALQTSLKNIQAEKDQLESELESERAKNVRANSDVVKKNGEIRTLNTEIASQQKQLAQKDATIETLKREIVSTKSMLTQNGDTDSMKQKNETMATELADKTKALEEANQKIKLFEEGTVVYVVEPGATGGKVLKKKIKIPYLAKNDVATVVRADIPNSMIALNKGTKDGVKEGQEIALKREGKFVAQVEIVTVGEDFSVASVNKKNGIPETIESGDALEMFAVEAPAEAAPAAAEPKAEVKAASDESEEAAPAADSEESPEE